MLLLNSVLLDDREEGGFAHKEGGPQLDHASSGWCKGRAEQKNVDEITFLI